jgi:pimeloyl-ACP methyl ester carboxylesterase
MKTSKFVFWLFLSLILFLGGGKAYTELQLRSIKDNYPPIGHFVTVDGLNIHYVRKGDGQPIVMLHGRDGALQEFTFSIFDQVSENYDAIAIDRPGYGSSEWPTDQDLNFQCQANIIRGALAEMNIDNPILIGHSYGGAVVLQYLLDYPDTAKGAILLGPVAYIEDPPDGAELFTFPNIPILGPVLTRTILMPLGGKIADGLYQQAFFPDEAPEDYVTTMKSLYLHPAQFTATAQELSVMQTSVQAISPNYDQIQIRVTVISGTMDQMVDVESDAQQLVQDLQCGNLILVENSGHKFFHTHPEIVIEAIDDINMETY